MNEGPKPGRVDIHAAMRELLEAQRKIDETAKGIVDRTKRLIDVREILVPGANETYERLHGEWYRAVERDLAAAGFQSFGPYKDVNARPDTPPEKQAYYHLALSADRTITAGWFLVAAKEPRPCLVLESVATDGRVIATMSGITESGLPVPSNRDIERFPADTPVVRLVADHHAHLARANTNLREFAGVEDMLEERLRQANETAAHRRQIGLGIFEPYLRTLSRGRFEEKGRPLLESILANPEWWTGEEPSAPSPGAVESLNLRFLMSRDDAGARRHVATVGLAQNGLPELQMRGLAANHCRAARFLLSAVARKIGERAACPPPSADLNRLAGAELTLTRDEVLADMKRNPFGAVASAGEARPVAVRLELEEFGGALGQAVEVFSVFLKRKRAEKLLTVVPPSGSAVDRDDWLYESCHLLGLAVPPAKPFSALEESMDAASQRAVGDLPRLRARLNADLPVGQFAMIKTGLDSTTGAKEYVWVRVARWPEGEFVGALAVQPVNCPGYTQGQVIRVADSDVFDRVIFSASEGAIEPSLTDLVAMDFGVDLPG
jgi:hypothetical protein